MLKVNAMNGKIIKSIFFALLFGKFLFPATSSMYNIKDYGAKGNGETVDTKAIQKTIDDCAQKGGGIVYFPNGTYLSGTIVLKNNVVINLSPGSKLIGSRNIDDYPLLPLKVVGSENKRFYRALIAGENLENVAIMGLGLIEGQGKYLQGLLIRPFLLKFIGCKEVTVKDVTLKHSAAWTQHYLNCDGVTLRDLKIYSHGGENNDLIDIDRSKNVIIDGIRGDSDDDGITLKSAGAGMVENVTISNCIIRTRTNAIKAGTESYGGFRNITVNNCIIGPSLAVGGYSGRDEGLAGIALEIVDGGIMENVNISNIIIEETAAPIFIRLGNRARDYKPDLASKSIGSLGKIKISNIIAKNAGRTGCSIIGEIGHPVKDITLSNININFDGGGTLEESRQNKPELVNEYPECIRLGHLPSYAFFIRHAEGITFRDVEFSYNEADHRPAVICDDIRKIKIMNFNAQTEKDALGQIVMRNTRDVYINNCSPDSASVFFHLQNNSKDIAVIGNDFSRIAQPLRIDETIKTEVLRVAGNIPAQSNLFEFLQPNITRDSLAMVHIYFPNNVEIRYTTNGKEPQANSKKYTKPFKQIKSTVIRAAAFKSNKSSGVAALQLGQAEVIKPHIIPANRFFYEKIVVKIKCNTPDARIYYTLDGSEPTQSSQNYNGALNINQSSILKAKAFKTDYKASETAVSRYQIIEKKKGVQYKYFEDHGTTKREKLPNFLTLTPMTQGRTDKFSFDKIKHSETYFALLMHGFITIKKSGKYTFYCASNDGSKLLIDNKLVINNDGNHALSEKTGKVYLDKGEHLLEVQYYQAGGGKQLLVSWEGPGFDKREINIQDLN